MTIPKDILESQPGVVRPNGSVKETVWYATLVISIVTLIFTAGYNWRRVDELTAKAEAAETNFQRKDVASEQWQSLTLQIQQLRALVEQNGRDARERAR